MRTAATTTLEIHLLGQLEVMVDGHPVPVAGARQRALLAFLALHANDVVSRERLIDAAWGDSPPETVHASLNVAISKLRRALGAGVLETTPRGYVLRIDEDRVDLRRFEALVAEGSRVLASGDAERASAVLRDALALWRGPPLDDFAVASFAQPEIARLEELRLVALEERIEADLQRGGRSVLAGELEALGSAHP